MRKHTSWDATDASGVMVEIHGGGGTCSDASYDTGVGGNVAFDVVLLSDDPVDPVDTVDDCHCISGS